jgi:predicted DNA-binding transcriptional regulator YafY
VVACFSRTVADVRAERMVAIVLLLQAHRQLTVSELAARLEISERTVRRDLDALLLTGIPIYSRRGRGGGWSLVDRHRINLSTLTHQEAQALFLVAGREMLTGLGIDRGVTSALRKLLAALPEATRSEVAKIQQGVYLDPTRWGQRQVEAPMTLTSLRDAILAGRQVELSYAKSGHPATRRTVHPHGLVCKNGAWYLLAGTTAGLRVFRVSRIETMAVLSEAVDRPADFDLVRAWDDVNRGMPNWPILTVTIEVQPDAVDAVQAAFGPNNLTLVGRHEPPRFTVPFASVDIAVTDLLMLGNQVRVLDPPAVQTALARIGAELVDTYGQVRSQTAY